MPPAAPSAPPVYRGAPAPPIANDLILREIVDDDPPPPLAQGIILTELPPEEPPPAIAAGIILGEIADEPELIEGFESTAIEPVAFKPRSEPPPPPPPSSRRGPHGDLEPFPIAACPSCGVALAEPPPAFCDSCGTRLPRVRRAPQGVAAQAVSDVEKRCRPCGAKNGAGRTRCVDCGAPL